MRSATAMSSRTGTALSADSWLDDHFTACATDYAAMVDAVNFPPGARLLDLGSGTGAFATLLRKAIGPEGDIIALDVDAANLRQVRGHDVATSAVLGSALHLPFHDESFDAVWSANLTQYFDDADLEVLLSEVVRVARRGALIAIKDVDMSALCIFPGSPLLGPHLAEVCAQVPPVSSESIGSIRGRALRGWLQSAGLCETSQQTFPIEYLGPLNGAARRVWTAWLPYLAGLAAWKGVPGDDLATWAQVSEPQTAAAFVQRKDFYGCELQILAVGRKRGKPNGA